MTDRTQRRLAAIISADVVGYSRLMGIDEAGTHGRLKARFAELIDPKTKEHGGRIVKLMGDGILAEFPSAIDAVKWAVELQTSVAELNGQEDQDQRIEYRVGVNLGDVIVDGDDIFGDGVNVAARLQEIAEPGGICVSDKIHMEVQGKVGVEFADGGAQTMKNIEQPVQVWRWSGTAGEQAGTHAIEQDAKPSLPDKPSIAVLPLDSMSSDPEHEYLADGMTEDIITLLARIPSFFVIARNSSFSYKGTRPDIRQVGRELGVRYVVEGSLRQIGNRLRVTVQLIEAESGNHLWAERFDRKADDLFEVQDEITMSIVTRLEPELTRAAFDLARRRPPADMDAWDFYQQANSVLAINGWHASTFEEAVELCRKAIALDPNFAPARALLSLLLAVGHMHGRVSEPDEALSLADLALTLDSGSSEVLGFAGCAISDLGNKTRGIELLDKAIEQDPSNAQAWAALGAALLTNHQPELAVEKLEYSLRISPRDNRLGVWGSVYALALGFVDRIDEGIEQARLACRRDDRLHNPRVILAALLIANGRPEEAVSALGEARRIYPNLSIGEVRGLVGGRYAKTLQEIW